MPFTDSNQPWPTAGGFTASRYDHLCQAGSSLESRCGVVEFLCELMVVTRKGFWLWLLLWLLLLLLLLLLLWIG